MLFFCAWPDAPNAPCSLVIDATTKERAIELATTHAEGPKPSRVVPIVPDVFVCEVIEPSGDGGAYDVESDVVLIPLDATDTLWVFFKARGAGSTSSVRYIELVERLTCAFVRLENLTYCTSGFPA